MPAVPGVPTVPASRRIRSTSGPGIVKVTFGALSAVAQFGARVLEHLGAGFQRAAQLVPLACRVDAQLSSIAVSTVCAVM